MKKFRGPALRVRGVAKSLGVSLLAAVLAGGVGVAVVFGLVRLFKARNYGPFVIKLPFEGGFVVCLLLAAAAITLGLRAWLLRRVTGSESLAGALVIWVALTLAITFTLPGIDYLFVWPALLGTVALLLSGGGAGAGRRESVLLVLLTAVPAPLLLAPTILLLHEAITIGLAPLFMALTTLALSLLPFRPKQP